MKLIILILFNILFKVSLSSQKEVILDSNTKLQNILVSVKDDVPWNGGVLFERIKTYLNEASKALWTATGNMKEGKRGVQFGTVYIVVPESWNVTKFDNVTWQQCSRANIFITTDKDNGGKTIPFTKQIGRCGDLGDHTRFPVSFFDKDVTSSKGREMMKEFMKLRYGVFGEEPYNNKTRLYDDTKPFWSRISCGENVALNLVGNPLECIRENNNCTYRIVPNQSHHYSVMFDHHSDKSIYFCDDDVRPHNREADSYQNRKCDKRSITNVTLSHSDFNLNLPKNSFEETKFIILKNRNRKIVLVLDTSGSMQSIIHNMKTAASYFLNNAVENQAEVGLVSFGDNAKIHNGLLPMNTLENRDRIIKNINNLAAIGFTNVPDGLRKGVEVLNGNFETFEKTFGTIFLLSDGSNNLEEDVWTNETISRIASKGIVVNTISYHTAGDKKLNLLAKMTGGRFEQAGANTFSNLVEKFSYRDPCEDHSNSLIKVYQADLSLDSIEREQEVNFTYIDKYVGKNLSLLITLPINLNQVVSLISPDNKEYFHSSSTTENVGVTLKFDIQGETPAGWYKLKFTSLTEKKRIKRSSDKVHIPYIISSFPDPDSTRVINPSGQLSQFQIQEVNERTLVTATVDLSTSQIQKNDNVLITLSMKHEKKDKIERRMFDNGIGCDSIPGDQIFATCINPKDLTLEGYYTFNGNVEIIPYGTSEQIKRTVDLGALRVIKVLPNIQDRIPPSRIESVDIIVVDRRKKVLRIEFLATGDDGLTGNITQYHIKIISSNEKIVSVNQQVPPLQPVSVLIGLNNVTSDASFKVSVRGVDKAGNEGEWSPEQFFVWKKRIINPPSKVPHIITTPRAFAGRSVFTLSILITNLLLAFFVY